jgi:hypothetical protein
MVGMKVACKGSWRVREVNFVAGQREKANALGSSVEKVR